jgi:hypothetical protein
MSPDLSSSARGGLVALGAALVAALALGWFAWSDQPEIDARLEAARAAAAKISGKEPLKARVERQRAANVELRSNIAQLKNEAGFRRDERFTVPPSEREPGKFFANRFVEVRQALREQAMRRRIDSDERLGFPPDDRVPPDSEAQQLLDMLQLTEKALRVVLDAPDPVEWFDISHGKPYETGPVARPPLLAEYPLTLKLRGSLPTVLWILHQFGTRSERDYPLILRGLTIRSGNSKPKDDVQQLEAVFELAGMAFLADTTRDAVAAPPPRERSAVMRARP